MNGSSVNHKLYKEFTQNHKDELDQSLAEIAACISCMVVSKQI